jgi:ribonuclease HI
LAKKNYYAVVHGHVPGIYQSWEGVRGAQAQVSGYPGARYRGFSTYANAVAWFRELSGGNEPQLFGQSAASQPALLQPISPDEAQSKDEPNYVVDLQAGKVVIFTDGSSIGNPGPGGYGAILFFDGKRREISGGYRMTTNNRMELIASIVALKSFDQSRNIVLYSDSNYVVRGINEGWARRWRTNNWKRNGSEHAENADLWTQLLDLVELHQVEFRWLAGHRGIAENERCDQLAREAAQGKYLQPDYGYES